MAARQIWERLNAEHAPSELNGAALGFLAWAACQPQGAPLPLLAAWRGEQAVALLPVRSGRRHIKGVNLRVLESASSDHWKMGSPIVGHDPVASIAALLEGLCAQRHWDMLELGPMLDGSEAVSLLIEHGRRLGLRPQICGEMQDPVVKLTGKWNDYYSNLSGNLRSQVKRGEAKLAKQGRVVLEEYHGGPDLETRLEDFYRVEASGWKGREGTAITSSPVTQRFYTELAREAAQCGWLRLYTLKVGEHRVAADYCLAFGRTIAMLKVGYDEGWSHCSPGQVMRKRVLEHLFASGQHDIYDLLPGGGDHGDYKMRWGSQVRRCLMLRLFNPRSMRGRLAAGASRLRAWLRDRRSAAATPLFGAPAGEAA